MSSQNTQTSSTSNVCIDARIANEISKRVGAFLASEAGFTSISPRAHEALADAIETYFDNLIITSHSFAELACRTQPNLKDIEKALEKLGVRTGGLETFLGRCQTEKYRRLGSALRTSFRPASPLLKPTPEMLASDEEDELEATMGVEDKRRDRIGKSGGELKVKEKSDSLSRPAYVPTHLPPFPSKHSYKRTPIFPKRSGEDPRQLNMEQVRLIENSLQKLIAAEDQVYFPSVGSDSSPSSSTVVSSTSSDYGNMPEQIPIINYETFTLRNLAKKSMQGGSIDRKPWENIEITGVKRKRASIGNVDGELSARKMRGG